MIGVDGGVQNKSVPGCVSAMLTTERASLVDIYTGDIHNHMNLVS